MIKVPTKPGRAKNMGIESVVTAFCMDQCPVTRDNYKYLGGNVIVCIFD